MTEASRLWLSLFAGEARPRAILGAIPARVALLDRERRHGHVDRECDEFPDFAREATLRCTVAALIGDEAGAQPRAEVDRRPARWREGP